MHPRSWLFVLILVGMLANVHAYPEGWSDDIWVAEAGRPTDFLIDSNGNLNVVGVNIGEGISSGVGGSVSYLKFSRTGNRLVSNIKLDFDSARHEGPSDVAAPTIEEDGQGNFHIFYSISEGFEVHPPIDVFYTKVDKFGNTVVLEKNITHNPYEKSSYHPAAGIDSDDNIHLVWKITDSNGRNIHYAKLNNSGNILIPDTQLTNSGAFHSVNPSVNIDSEDNVNIIWKKRTVSEEIGENTPFDHYFMKLDKNGNILVGEKKIQTGIPVNFYSTSYHAGNNYTAIDGSDTIHLTWGDANATFSNLHYAKLDTQGNLIGSVKTITNENLFFSQSARIAVQGLGANIVWTRRKASLFSYYSLTKFVSLDAEKNITSEFFVDSIDSNSGLPQIATKDDESYILRFWKKPITPFEDESALLYKYTNPPKRPVVLVHGILSNPQTWDSLVNSLENDGYVQDVNLFLADLDPGLCGLPFTTSGCAISDIREYAKVVRETVNLAKEVSGQDKVNLIAHSMGGLASRWYMQQMHEESNVDKFITLGTPHFGTELATHCPYFAIIFGSVLNSIDCADSFTQMTPGSHFLALLKTAAPITGPFYTFAGASEIFLTSIFFSGPNDGAVNYASAYGPDWKEDGFVYDLDHLQIHTDSNTISRIKQLLDEDLPPLLLNSQQFTEKDWVNSIDGNTSTNKTHTNQIFKAETAWVIMDDTNGAILTLKTPSGTTIDQNSLLATYQKMGNIQGYEIPDPEVGDWNYVISTNKPTQYTIHTSVDSNLSFTIDPSDQVLAPGANTPIRVTLQNQGAPFLGQSVIAYVMKPDLNIATVTLFDDGIHSDGVANDGVYGNYFNQNSLEGKYSVEAFASGNFGGQPYILKAEKTFHLYKFPNLKLDDFDVQFSNYVPPAGETVTISAKIQNIGSGNAPNAKIDFFNGDPTKGGILIGTDTISISGGGFIETASIQWAVPPGKHWIYVRPDPANNFYDADYDNEVGKWLLVGNTAPVFVTQPKLNTVPGAIYQYDATAIDAENHIMSFLLTQNPVGMWVVPQTGVITWNVPPQSASGGNPKRIDSYDVNVEIEVRDNQGGVTTQAWVLHVGPALIGPSKV